MVYVFSFFFPISFHLLLRERGQSMRSRALGQPLAPAFPDCRRLGSVPTLSYALGTPDVSLPFSPLYPGTSQCLAWSRHLLNVC